MHEFIGKRCTQFKPGFYFDFYFYLCMGQHLFIYFSTCSEHVAIDVALYFLPLEGGVLQGSILDQLFFLNYMIDLVLMLWKTLFPVLSVQNWYSLKSKVIEDRRQCTDIAANPSVNPQ